MCLMMGLISTLLPGNAGSMFPLVSFTLLFLAILTPMILLPFKKGGGSQSSGNNSQKHLLPPGPRKLPVIGNLHQVSPSLYKSIPKLAAQHGPILFLQLGSVPTVVLSSVAAAREMFKDHDLVFSGRPEQHAARKLSYNFNAISFAPYGVHWREARKIAILELLSSKRVQSFSAVRDDEIKLVLDLITCSSEHHETINLSELSLLLASNVASRLTFGQKLQGGRDGSKSKFHQPLHETPSLLGEFCASDYLPWLSWLNKLTGLDRRLDACFRLLDELYDEVIREHMDPSRPIPDHEDFVDVLLRIQRDPNRTTALSDEQIKGILTDMFIAGSDTSATAIVWTMAELMRHPSAMNIARNEIREAVKGKKRVEESDLSKLTYLKNVIKESLRLHPPVPFLLPHKTLGDCSIGGYDIPAGTMVLVDAEALGKDPERWESPDEFLPERFWGSEVDFRGQHYELLPFGAGRRGCPGLNFGALLVEIVLANLIGCFDWDLPRGMTKEDLDMEGAFGLTMFKKTPLCLLATPVQL